jgi:hypothetical protein
MLFALRMMNGLNPTLCSVDDGTEGDGGDGKPPVVVDPDADPAAEGRLKALKAERAQRQALEAELATMKATQEAARVKAAEEQGQFKELYQENDAKLIAANVELDAFKAKDAARVEAQTAKATAAVEALPDNLKALVPKGLDADATLALVEGLKALGPTGPTGTMGAGGKLGKVNTETTGAEKAEITALQKNHPLMAEDTALRIIRARKKS